MIDETTEETTDIVTVTLQQESAVEIAIRKLQAGQTIQDGARSMTWPEWYPTWQLEHSPQMRSSKAHSRKGEESW